MAPEASAPAPSVPAASGDGGPSVAGSIGYILPPPEIRQIVDKTAAFVARSGPEFEERIREKEKYNPKFCFLNINDPYRAYYEFKVKDAKEGKAAEVKSGEQEKSERAVRKQDSKPIPKEPPPFDFVSDMPNISAQDLDILRLTALFAARNGRQFLAALSQREQRNYQFDFLRPNHSLYNYFTSLVSQYNKILVPQKTMMGKLRDVLDNKFSVLEQINARAEYEQYIADQKMKAEQEADQERGLCGLRIYEHLTNAVAYAMIDWHDFVVVETVEFVEADEVLQLPPPISIMDLEGMTLAQKKAAVLFEPPQAAAEEQGGDMDMDMEEEDDTPAPQQRDIPKPKMPTMPMAPPPIGAANIKIRSDYVPK
ncbi:hypothetical protein HK101_003312, partial [Irineochytrium annulatum]